MIIASVRYGVINQLLVFFLYTVILPVWGKRLQHVGLNPYVNYITMFIKERNIHRYDD